MTSAHISYRGGGGAPGVPYLLKKNIGTSWAGSQILTNSEGLRNNRDFKSYDSDTFRVLVIGDSLVFGYGVGQDQTIPAHLEKLIMSQPLPSGKRRAEVVNGGIEGFSAINEAALIEHLIPRYTPDVIVWLLIGNDWDDDLSVTPAGTMTTDKGTYAAAAQWLNMTWGVSGRCINYENIFENMGPTQRAWAAGDPLPRSFLPDLGKYSYLYALLRSRLAGSAASPEAKFNDRCYPTKKESGVAEWPYFPQFEAIYASPQFNERFLKGVTQGVSAAHAADIPIILLGLDIPLAGAQVPKSATIFVDDAVSYLGMDFDSFRGRYNLGWDPHFNSAGNKLLASSMHAAMVRNGMLPKSADGPLLDYHDRAAYWQQYAAWRAEHIEKYIFNDIDFDNFRHVHQLVGGLYPPRIFPVKDGAPLNVILRGSNEPSTLVLAGVNSSGAAMRLGMEITGMAVSPISAPEGEFSLSIPVLNGPESSRGVVDVVVTCRQEKCEKLKISTLHLTANKPVQPPAFLSQTAREISPAHR